MARWRRGIGSVGIVCAAFGVACGSGASGTGSPGVPTSRDAGPRDSTAPSDDSGGSGFGDGAVGDDATVSDAGDDGGDDASDATADAVADDASSDAAADSAGEGGSGGSDGGDASADTGAGIPADGGDAGKVMADAGPDASTHDAGPTTSDGGSCNFTGTWASQITIDVNWAAGGTFNIVIAPGSGTIKQWLLGTRAVNGTTVTDTTVVCGIQLPDFHGNVNETYGIRFPNSLFDNAYLPSFAVPGTVSGSTPMASYTTPAVAVLLGLTMANPATAPWPTSITTANDEDVDTKPGVTAGVAQGGGFSNVPLDFSVVLSPTTVARADRLYLAIRQVTAITSHFTDCDHASGSVTVSQLTDASNTKKYAIDSHVIGCGLAGSTTDCSTNQMNFVDQNQPVFVPTATEYLSKRVPAGTTCSTVRSSFQ